MLSCHYFHFSVACLNDWWTRSLLMFDRQIQHSTLLACVYVCAYDKHSFLIYSVYLERLPRSDSDIPAQRVFLLWYRTKECWAYALSSKKKEYYLFVQLQEGWFSYVNTHLILFVTHSTKSFIPMFKKKSFAVWWQRISAHSSSAAALRVLLHGEYYRFHPSRAASSLLWGKHFPKGLINEKKKKKAFCSPVWSCGQLRVVHRRCFKRQCWPWWLPFAFGKRLSVWLVRWLNVAGPAVAYEKERQL